MTKTNIKQQQQNKKPSQEIETTQRTEKNLTKTIITGVIETKEDIILIK